MKRSNGKRSVFHPHCELLEDRLTPTAGPLSLWTDLDSLQASGATAREWQGNNTYVYPDQWIAHFDGLAGNRLSQLATMRTKLASLQGQVDVLDQLGSSGTFLLRADGSLSDSNLRAILSPLASLRYVEPNFALAPHAVPNDPSFPSQWALNNTGASGGVADADIDAPEAWDLATGSSGVVVGVIDSGVMYTHPDLVNNMWVNPGEVAGDGLDNDGNGYVDDIYGYDFANNDSDPMDDDGHGTAVSGIIAGSTNNNVGVAGINWGGKIMALKYARAGFVASTADVIEAVNYTTMMRRDYGVNIRATNNSYGIFGYSQALADAIQANGDEGILFVSSAGNSNTNNDFGPQYPANYPISSVLSVAATTRQDLKASFSSFGASTVQLGAPGLDVLTTRLGGGYSGFSGTSAASPVVAGVAALLWDYAPYATLPEIRQAILDGTDPIPALAGITVTGGRVNAYQSMLRLGFVVRDVTPAFNSISNTPPTTFTVRFSDLFDPSTVDAGDLQVNGVLADSVSVVNDSTLSFSFLSSPVVTPGIQTISFATDTIRRLSDGDSVAGMSTTFRYDPISLAVSSASPSAGSVALSPLSSIVLTFNETFDPTSISTRDLVINQGQVTGFQVTGPNTVQFNLTGVEREGSLTYSVPRGSIKDLSGNPSDSFTASIDLDVVSRNLPKSFERLAPLGSLILASLGNTGLSNQAGDIDEYTFDVLAGETLSAVVRPNNLSASISAQWVGLGPLSTGPAPGQATSVGIVTAPTDGTYTLRIVGDRTSSYSFDIYRNTLIESQDTSDVSPLSLAPSLIPVGEGRYAVVGTSDVTRLLWTMDTNPGWTLGSQWSWGKPNGLGGDPNSAFTGQNVIGNNLNGAYANRLTTTNYATLGPVSLVGKTGTTLSFRRWLGIESSTLDRANIQVSNNGTTWTTIFQNSASNLQETAWSLQTYDISAIADNQPTVYVRFGIGTTSTTGALSGWNIDDVAIRGNEDGPAKTQEQDVYTVDLTGSVGRAIDVSLAGLTGVDFSTSRLELVAPNGSIVRTAGTTTSGVNTIGTNLVIEDYVVTQPGVYRLVLTSSTLGQYSLVVTDNVVLETEPNNSSPGPARSIDRTGQAIGFVGIPDLLGSRTFTVDSSQSLLTMQAKVVFTGGSLELPIVEQAPGSLDAPFTGQFTVQRSAEGLTFQSANLDIIANAGSFFPGSAPADIAGQVNLGGLVAQAAIRNIMFTLSSGQLAVDSDGYFDASGLLYEFTDGQISYSALGTSSSFPVNTPDLPNAPGMMGRIEFIPGAARITIPLGLRFIANVPLGFDVDFNFSAVIVATTPMPIKDTDAYTVTLNANEALEFGASSIFLPGRPASEALVPNLQVIGPGGVVIPATIMQDPGQTSAMGRFVAPAAGVYRLIVSADGGLGEYILSTQKITPPVASLSGLTLAVRGEPIPFTLSAGDNRPADLSESWFFAIDWNGDGSVDESVVAPSGTTIEHVFETNGNYNVQMTATRWDGVVSNTFNLPVSIVAMTTRANPNQPARTDLIIGGTTGIDAYMFLGNFMLVLMEDNQVYGTVLPSGQLVGSVQIRSLPSFNGSFIVYAQAGNDLVYAEFVVNPTRIFGGDGNDALVGGLGDDWIDGGAGNDFLEGGDIGPGGNDTILGGTGNDILVGGIGADLLRGGAGSDLLIAGRLVVPGYHLTGRYALQAEWGSTRSYEARVGNIKGSSVGEHLNGNYQLIPGTTVLNDSAIDTLLGEEDQDFFVADPTLDLLTDRQEDEDILSL
ncbi:S8 family serine peptidase [bacterium]|nr:S8 family serine peptidase [bacterium]